jgi:ketosteroid isomerase-like protein
MKHHISVILLLVVATPAFAQCTDADTKALEAFDHAWGDAIDRGDRVALNAILADEFQGFRPSGSFGKTEDIEMSLHASEQNRAKPADAPRVSYAFYDFACTPNTATITHRTATTLRVDGKDQTSYSRAVHFLEKRSGRWQVVSNASHPLDDAGVLAYMERERTGTRADTTATQRAGLSDFNARITGDTAVVTGINHYVGREPDGKPMDRRVRFTDVFVKRDGRWQVSAAQATPIPQ